MKKQTRWFVAGLGAVSLVLLPVLWRLRTRPSSALVPLGADPALHGWELQVLPGGAGKAGWRDRAIMAEVKAERARQAMRSGMLGWMKDKIFQTLLGQRAELLSAQQKAGLETRELEQRLEQLHAPLQDRIDAYEKQIEVLERELAAKGEGNRELIGARIATAKQRLSAERDRERFGKSQEFVGLKSPTGCRRSAGKARPPGLATCCRPRPARPARSTPTPSRSAAAGCRPRPCTGRPASCGGPP